MTQPHHSFPEVFTWIFDIWLSAIKHTLEIHDTSGNLIAILQNAYDGVYTEAINQAPTLSFKIPGDDSKGANIVKANEFWLVNYEAETPTVINKFRLSGRADGRQRAGVITIEIEADGLISQLADEQLVTVYTPDSLTVNQITTALLALQVLTPNITEGTIAPTDTISMSYNAGDTILKCLYRLRDIVGGYISVDNDRVLQWANSLGEDKGQQIRYGKNLLGITRKIDYTTIANRIYAYGAGQGDARVKLSDATGSPPDFVEDAGAGSSQETNGIYVKTMVDRSITDADALLAWANLQLADLKDPLITYTIETADLSESTEAGFSFEPLQLGSIITVIDEDLGLDVSVHVVKMTHKDIFEHPEQITIEVTNLTSSNPDIRSRDILDVISGIEEVQLTKLKAPPDPTEYSAIAFTIDGGEAVITTGEKGHWPGLPFAGEIVEVILQADQSGSIVIDIWKTTYAGSPPVDGNSITASAPPTLSGAQKSLDTTLTGWTKTFAEGDVLAYNVDSVTDIEQVTLTLKVRRT